MPAVEKTWQVPTTRLISGSTARNGQLGGELVLYSFFKLNSTAGVSMEQVIEVVEQVEEQVVELDEIQMAMVGGGQGGLCFA
jgi:hypothetical protein